MLDSGQIRTSLKKLREAQFSAFGSEEHSFLLHEPLSEDSVVAFELRHQVRLPEDYRTFITRIGNGGAGPHYGVFPLGMMDQNLGIATWEVPDGIVGTLRNPFPHDAAWNIASVQPNAADETESDLMAEAFEKRYWDRAVVDGAFPICHLGCALRIWLVVSGSLFGNLWYDGRAEFSGLKPILQEHNVPMTFGDWYMAWISRCLLEANLT